PLVGDARIELAVAEEDAGDRQEDEAGEGDQVAPSAERKKEQGGDGGEDEARGEGPGGTQEGEAQRRGGGGAEDRARGVPRVDGPDGPSGVRGAAAGQMDEEREVESHADRGDQLEGRARAEADGGVAEAEGTQRAGESDRDGERMDQEPRRAGGEDEKPEGPRGGA